MGALPSRRENPFMAEGLLPGITLRLDVSSGGEGETHVSRVEDIAGEGAGYDSPAPVHTGPLWHLRGGNRRGPEGLAWCPGVLALDYALLQAVFPFVVAAGLSFGAGAVLLLTTIQPPLRKRGPTARTRGFPANLGRVTT